MARVSFSMHSFIAACRGLKKNIYIYIYIHSTYIATVNYLILNGRPNKSNPLIKSYIRCPTVQGEREVTRERGGPMSNYNLPLQQLLHSLPPSTQPIQYALSHILHHSVTYVLHPFPQQQCHRSLLVLSLKFIQPLSGTHSFAHIL